MTATKVDRRFVVYPSVGGAIACAIIGLIVGGDEVRKVAVSAMVDFGMVVAIAALAGKHGQPIWDGMGKKFGKEKPEAP